ncbi:hypothetical protein BKA59DRAFT_294186 [Fusarium tricinctum]|jgi:hypothetical protein|uniref:Uncharacterized protein n=1 Tax=Fusarium tricinctum TaxID=61284 RepID=A0A8K0RRL0_9HYPO|nr:hypothetical protein BKA59DRAFT_294186 [Fusarium tricinctum]
MVILCIDRCICCYRTKSCGHPVGKLRHDIASRSIRLRPCDLPILTPTGAGSSMQGNGNMGYMIEPRNSMPDKLPSPCSCPSDGSDPIIRLLRTCRAYHMHFPETRLSAPKSVSLAGSSTVVVEPQDRSSYSSPVWSPGVDPHVKSCSVTPHLHASRIPYSPVPRRFGQPCRRPLLLHFYNTRFQRNLGSVKAPDKEVVAYVVLSVIVFDKENKVLSPSPIVSPHDTGDSNDLSWTHLSLINIWFD